MVFCAECGDEFDPVENADTDIPLCSSECEAAFWESVELESTYVLGRYGGAPVFG